MKGKILFVAGLGVGYVLGARAGRKRYDQIAAAARKVWETPGIQRQVNQVQDFAAARVGEIPGALVDAGKKIVSSAVSTKRGSASQTQRTTAGEPTAPTAADTRTTAKKPAAKKPAAKRPAASTAKKPATKRPSGGASGAKDGE